MVSSATTRTAFANNVLAFLQLWGFDGIDIGNTKDKL